MVGSVTGVNGATQLQGSSGQSDATTFSQSVAVAKGEEPSTATATVNGAPADNVTHSNGNWDD